MRLEHLNLKGLLAITDVVALNLRDVPPGLVAITGENGAGKTTLLEAPFAGLHRQFASREGTLTKYATGRDSYIDQTFTIDGRGTFRTRVSLDERGGTNALLEQILPDGQHVPLNDGKATTFDEAVRTRFVSPEMMLASSVGAQNKRGSFTAASKRERKDLFAELLGLQAYQRMSESAAACAALLDRSIAQETARLAQLRRETDDHVRAELDQWATHLDDEERAAAARRDTLAVAIRACEERLAIVTDAAGAYAALTQRVRALDADLATRRAEREAVLADMERSDREFLEAGRRITTKRDADVADAERKIAGNQQIQAQADAIAVAIAAVLRLDAALTTLRARQRDVQAEKDQHTARKGQLERQLAGLDQTWQTLTRVKDDARILQDVPCAGEGRFAACAFLMNAQAALPQIADLETTLTQHPTLVQDLAGVVAAEERSTRELLELTRAITTAEREKAEAQALAKYEAALAESTARIAELRDKIRQADVDARGFQATVFEMYERDMAESAARRARLDELLVTLHADLADARDLLKANETGHAQAVVAQAELGQARLDWDATIAALARIAPLRDELGRRRTTFAANRAERDALAAQVTAWQTEQQEWQGLATALGRDGLPTLEIDASGGAIATYTNTLLEVCFGPRFTVDLITQAAKADGKGLKEAFTVAVYDNLRGGEPRDVADLSGGEQTIVAEALMNAISLYANQRAALPIRTAWRDEMTGALDPENAARYLQMLRKVHELGDYVHIFFITHNPDVAACADAQIRVAHGQATIVLAPFDTAAAA